MAIFKRSGYNAGRGDDPHGVTRNPFTPDVTKSTGLNTRYNETQGKNEVGLRREGPSSYKSSVSNKVYINLHENADGGKTWVDEKSPAGKTQSKSDKRDAKALKKINSPKAMEKSAKAGQAYDAAKAADTRLSDNWTKPDTRYIGSEQEAADNATVKTMKTGGVGAVAKQVKKNPSMQKDAQDVRTKRIMDEKR
jgi:hypothetical protein